MILLLDGQKIFVPKFSDSFWEKRGVEFCKFCLAHFGCDLLNCLTDGFGAILGNFEGGSFVLDGCFDLFEGLDDAFLYFFLHFFDHL